MIGQQTWGEGSFEFNLDFTRIFSASLGPRQPSYYNIYIIFFFTLPGPQAKDIYKIQAKNTRRKNTCSNAWKSELFHTHILIGAADLSRLKCARIQKKKYEIER